MRVVILGSGSPRPDLLRSQPSVWIEEDGFSLLVDCGDGTVGQLQRKGIDLANVTAVLFTHLHSDHTLGYGQFLLGGWSLGRRRLTVFGPTATREFHSIWVQHLYPQDIAYRLSVGRTPRGLTEDVTVHAADGAGTYALGPFQVSYMPVVHSIPTLAFRLESSRGEAAVISGDTAYHEPLAAFAKGADLLVHEACMAPTSLYDPQASAQGEVVWRELARHHSSPEEAGRIAQEAGAGHLILTHLLPGTDTEQTYRQCRRVYDGRLAVAKDFLEWRADGFLDPSGIVTDR